VLRRHRRVARRGGGAPPRGGGGPRGWGLRSLDLLHAACAVTLRGMGEPVDSLVAFDRDFERARGLLEAEGIAVKVLS